MPRKDSALLLDMLLAAQKILRFTNGLTRETLADAEMALSAILREFQVIGEAARMLSDDAKAKHSHIPWRVIAGLCNRVIHEYFNIDLDILWATIENNLPKLIQQLEAIVPVAPDDEKSSEDNQTP